MTVATKQQTRKRQQRWLVVNVDVTEEGLRPSISVATQVYGQVRAKCANTGRHRGDLVKVSDLGRGQMVSNFVLSLVNNESVKKNYSGKSVGFSRSLSQLWDVQIIVTLVLPENKWRLTRHRAVKLSVFDWHRQGNHREGFQKHLCKQNPFSRWMASAVGQWFRHTGKRAKTHPRAQMAIRVDF